MILCSRIKMKNEWDGTGWEGEGINEEERKKRGGKEGDTMCL